jgi:hypothetical protein
VTDTHECITFCTEIQPFEILHDCQIVSGWDLTSQLGFQGSNELAYAHWQELECTFEVGGHYDSMCKVMWHPVWDKSNQLSLKSTTTLSSNTKRVFDAVEDPKNPH